MLQAEFPGSDFVQPFHHLVFKSGDHGGKHISEDFQVSYYLRMNVGFNLSRDSGNILLI
jgi:hypothetical protein